jgi:hypothetical protein
MSERATGMRRRLPARSWVGLAVMIVSEAATLARIEPFYTWHTPTAWTGYILFVDGVVWKRRGNSWISHSSAELLFLAIVSVPLWLVFEFYNKYAIQNWHYVGLPDPPLRYLGYAWSFATIWPAIFETGELVSSFRDARASPTRATPPQPHSLTAGAWISIAVGTLMLVGPLLYPSQYLAAPIWLGFIFVLDPLNARAGSESLIGDWRAGSASRLVNLAAAGLICGIVWEFWNYWAGGRWEYTVPILPQYRIFEMPLPGYGGFPPFAVECFTMYVAVRRWIWRSAGRPISV